MERRCIADQVYQEYRPIKVYSEVGKTQKVNRNTQTNAETSEVGRVFSLKNLAKEQYWRILYEQVEGQESQLTNELEVNRHLMLLMTKRIRAQEKYIRELKKKIRQDSIPLM